MSLAEAFKQQPFFERLGRRQAGFLFCMQHLDQSPMGIIVETGTARQKDNWWGDGQSTLIWDWALGQDQTSAYAAYSFDIDEAACETARGQAPRVTVACVDSLQGLRSFAPLDLADIRLLYLDSLDYDGGVDSALHHLRELSTVWLGLPRGCLVMVDDRHDDRHGKHVAIQAFMDGMGIKPAYVGYQIGWLKP